MLKGQSAKIIVDGFPELNLSGKVEEINNTKNEADAFKIVPPDNSSGNFIKLIERSPVTIKVEIPSAFKSKLKSRTSCSVKVATAL
ncbi:hypothetical protein D3C71_1864830 [compost metagenome]